MLESSTMQRDLGILVDGKLDTSQQCSGSQGGHPCSGGHQAQHNQLSQGGDCPSLLCAGAASPRVLGAVWASQYKKDIKLLESFESALPGMGQQQLLWATCARAGERILSQYGTGDFTMARTTFSSLPEVA